MATMVDVIKGVQSKTRPPGVSGLPPSQKGSVADDLRQAAMAGELDECYRYIHERGCDVNDRADGRGKWKSGVTALHVASGKGHVGIIGLLLEFGADTSVKNKDAELALHIASREGEVAAVLTLLEAERAKPAHVRRSERNHERSRVRTRDVHNKGKFRLPPAFGMSSDMLRATVGSTKSAISMAHATEGDGAKAKRVRGAKFTIDSGPPVSFDVANFGRECAAFDNQKLVEADPPFGESELTNAAACRGCLVMLTRGGNVKNVHKAMLAQEAGAIACVLINDADKEFEPKSSGPEAAEIRIPVVGVSSSDGSVIRHCIKRNPDALVDLSYSVIKNLQKEEDDERAEGGVHSAASVPNLPSVAVERSALLARPAEFFAKTLPVESEVVRRLVRSDSTRGTILREALERCMEVVAGSNHTTLRGAAARVHSITPVELTEAREAVAAEEQALLSTSASGDASGLSTSGSWMDSAEGAGLLAERKALTTEIEQFLHGLEGSPLVQSQAWNSAYAGTISGSMVAVQAPLGAGSRLAIDAIVELLNGLDKLRAQLKQRDIQIRAAEEAEAQLENMLPMRSALSKAAETPKSGPETPVSARHRPTPCPRAMRL